MFDDNRVIAPTGGRRAGFRLRRLVAPLLATGLMLCAGSAHAQAPTIWGSASPENVKAGTGRVTLSWGSSGADSCEYQGTAIPTSGSVEAGPYAAGTHSVTFSCANGAGTTSRTISWTAWDPPTLDSFSLSVRTIYENESVTASWRSTGANACHLSTGGGARSPNSSATFPAWSFSPGTIGGSMHCTGYGGSSNSLSVSLTVLAWVDTDGDGVHNDRDGDDDGDGMPDAWENANGLDPLASNANGDPDGDGDSNLTEYNNGTDPQDHETPRLLSASLSAGRIYDNESVTFSWRSRYATACRPIWVSSGASGAGDWGPSGAVTYRGSDFGSGTHTYEFYCTGGGKESARRTISLTVLAWIDTDGDGVHNDQDTDDDGDGMPDVWENANGLDPLADDAAADPDGDGDGNLAEYDNGTDPQTHEVAQLLDFRLARSSIFSDEAAEFDWNSRYADACRFADDTVNLGTGGPLSSAAGEFAAGTWKIFMYCAGPGGDSPARSVTLTVADRPAPPETPAADSRGFTGDHRLFRVEIDDEEDGGGPLARQHLVVRNINPGANPAILDFAMRESPAYDDFSLYSMNAAWLTPYDDQITALATRPVVGDYNHDGHADLGIVDLAAEHFHGLDRIVYARPGETGYVPARAAKLDGNAKDFFGNLSNWLGGLSAIEDDFDLGYRVGGGEDGNPQPISVGQSAGARPRVEFELDSAALLPLPHADPLSPPPVSALPAVCKAHLRFCSTVYVPPGAAALEMTFGRADFPGGVREPSGGASGSGAAGSFSVTFKFGAGEVAASAGNWAVVVVVVLVNWFSGGDSNVPSVGERDAALLWETVLRRVGASGAIGVGSPDAAKLEAALEEYLGVEVLEGALTDESLNELPAAILQPEAAGRVGALGDILTVLEYARGRMALPPKPAPRPPPPPGTVVCEGSHCIPVGCDADGNCLNEACGASEAGASGAASDDETVKTCLSEIDIVEICHSGNANPEMKRDPRYEKFCAEDDGSPIGIDLIAIPRCSIEISVSPDTARFEISNANPPLMPAITGTATAAAPGADDPAPEISWRAQVTHTAPAGCVANPNVNSPPKETGWLSAEAGRTFTPDFGGIFGGDFTLEASCRDPNRRNPSYASATASFERDIWGTEPTSTHVAEAVDTAAKNQRAIGSDNYYTRMVQKLPLNPGGRLGDEENGELVKTILKKISCHESGDASQFYETTENGVRPAAGGPRTAGMPVYGPGGDVGLMQICYERAPVHVWNWVENVNYGAELFRNNLQSFAYEHLVDEVKPILELDHKDDDELTNAERLQIRAEMRKYIREEAIHRYNAGGGPDNDGETLTMYWQWNSQEGRLDDVDLKDGSISGYVSSVDGETTESCSLL